MRKILLLTLIFLNFSVLPSDAVEKKVVIDRLTQAEAEDLVGRVGLEPTTTGL